MKFPWAVSEIAVYLRERVIPTSAAAVEDPLLGFAVGRIELQTLLSNAWIEPRINRDIRYFVIPGFPAIVDDAPLGGARVRNAMQVQVSNIWRRSRKAGTSAGSPPAQPAIGLAPMALISISIGERIG